VAVEVELHQKTARRLEAKLAWYTRWLNRGAFHDVVWYASEGAPRWAVERAIASAGEAQQMRVRPWTRAGARATAARAWSGTAHDGFHAHCATS
jgi:hypothetical protein